MPTKGSFKARFATWSNRKMKLKGFRGEHVLKVTKKGSPPKRLFKVSGTNSAGKAESHQYSSHEAAKSAGWKRVA